MHEVCLCVGCTGTSHILRNIDILYQKSEGLFYTKVCISHVYLHVLRCRVQGQIEHLLLVKTQKAVSFLTAQRFRPFCVKNV